jgi:hypothetical protein
MKSTSLSVGLGFALGGALTWFFVPAATGPKSENPAAAGPPIELPAWSWREAASPPLLSRHAANDAISGWLSLRAADGSAPSHALRAATLRALVLRLPPDAFPRLLHALSTLDGEDAGALRSIAFSGWATRDAPAAARWAISQRGAASDLASEALRVWSGQDAAAAAAWACALPDAKLARKLAGPALAALAESDPARALALARSGDEKFRAEVLGDIFDVIGAKDPAGTLRAFAPEFWQNGRGLLPLRATIAAWMQQDAKSALTWLAAQPGDPWHASRPGDTDGGLANWLSNVTDAVPEGYKLVADALASASGLHHQSTLLGEIFFQWNADHPKEALAWLATLTDPDLRINLLERATRDTLSDHPEQSLPLALAMPDSSRRTQRLTEMLGLWAKLDLDATVAWTKEHAAEPGVATASAAVHGMLLGALARDDPQAALAAWRALTDATIRHATVSDIAAGWGKTDPAAALQWAAKQRSQQPDTGRQWGANGDVLYAWSKQDPEAALRWVESLHADHEETAYYLQSLGGTLTEPAPRAATADLYSKIQDPALRAATLATHVREWQTKDPAAAKSWLATHPDLGIKL